ncbi:MAG: aminopeptidase P family N-terminal domain-containing protein, partial [Actinomycetota bacterium]
MVPAEEIGRRHAALREALAADGLDAVLVVEASDLVYLTGVMADAHLIVSREGDPVLLVRRGLERAEA